MSFRSISFGIDGSALCEQLSSGQGDGDILRRISSKPKRPRIAWPKV
jgi:hypothetical protein